RPHPSPILFMDELGHQCFNTFLRHKNQLPTLERPSSSRLLENSADTQDAQKCLGSHPPNPSAPRRAVPRARPQRASKDDPSKLARVVAQDGPDESPTARVQRGPS